jgi:hypothetical protein
MRHIKNMENHKITATYNSSNGKFKIVWTDNRDIGNDIERIIPICTLTAEEAQELSTQLIANLLYRDIYK